VARWLGADVVAAEQQQRRLPHRRPLSHVEGEQISVLAFGTNNLGETVEVHLHAGAAGLLIVCPEEATEPIKAAVEPVDRGPADALAAVLVAIAQMSDESAGPAPSSSRAAPLRPSSTRCWVTRSPARPR
jgi:hypothetical protein